LWRQLLKHARDILPLRRAAATASVVFSRFPAFLIHFMGVPKRKTSKMRLRSRKAANRWHAARMSKCPQCGSTMPGHTVCPSCGYYRGRQVLTLEGK
jgi:large subunit ribosomal protein L32